jgi:hypothetical protein
VFLPAPDPARRYRPRVDTVRVGTQRTSLDRAMGLSVGIFVLVIALDLAGLVFVTAADAGTLAGLVFLGPLVVVVTMTAFQCYVWGASRSIEWPLWVGDDGLVFFTPHGRVELPWDAVTGVGFRRVLWAQQLQVTVHPQAGPGSPGVVTTVTPARWRSIHRAGLLLPVRHLQIPAVEIAAATAACSRGRWTPVPVG